MVRCFFLTESARAWPFEKVDSGCSVQNHEVEWLRFSIKISLKQEWCSALSRINGVKGFTLRKGKRDTALIVC
jgi:hypothetical protein